MHRDCAVDYTTADTVDHPPIDAYSAALYHSFAGVSISTGVEAAGAFQRSTGLRAALVSSRRGVRVGGGGEITSAGFSSTSRAIWRMASTNRSSSSRDSLSVGSIISAPGTISGNDVV